MLPNAPVSVSEISTCTALKNTPNTGQTTLYVLRPPVLQCGWYLVPVSYYPVLGVPEEDKTTGANPRTQTDRSTRTFCVAGVCGLATCLVATRALPFCASATLFCGTWTSFDGHADAGCLSL